MNNAHVENVIFMYAKAVAVFITYHRNHKKHAISKCVWPKLFYAYVFPQKATTIKVFFAKEANLRFFTNFSALQKLNPGARGKMIDF